MISQIYARTELQQTPDNFGISIYFGYDSSFRAKSYLGADFMTFQKGHKSFLTEETKRKIGKSNSGKYPSEEAKKKMSLARLGTHPSEETRQKLSLMRKGKFLGEKNPQWKGGKFLKKGYVSIYRPEHPFCDKDKYICEHRLIMEQKIGRYLTDKEVIHHLDGDKSNNNPDNLYLFSSNGKHNQYHQFLRNLIREVLNGKVK